MKKTLWFGGRKTAIRKSAVDIHHIKQNRSRHLEKFNSPVQRVEDKENVSRRIFWVHFNFMVFSKKAVRKKYYEMWLDGYFPCSTFQDSCLALLDTYTWNASSYMLSALEMEAVGGSKYQRWTARERFQSNWEHTLICFCSESCHTCRRQNHHHSYTVCCYLVIAQVCKLFTYSSNILNDLGAVLTIQI